jgi:hypothetical protein
VALRTKLLKQGALTLELVRRLPIRTIVRALRQDRSTDLVVWVHHRYPEPWWRWLSRGDTALRDLALIKAVAGTGRPFRLVIGPAIGRVSNSAIVYPINAYNPTGLANYAASLVATLRGLEAQGNMLFPSADEAEFWENKVFMHRRFDELGVRSTSPCWPRSRTASRGPGST